MAERKSYRPKRRPEHALYNTRCKNIVVYKRKLLESQGIQFRECCLQLRVEEQTKDQEILQLTFKAQKLDKKV